MAKRLKELESSQESILSSGDFEGEKKQAPSFKEGGREGYPGNEKRSERWTSWEKDLEENPPPMKYD